MVKDEGSWLDIGTTISHFVIASMIGIFVAGLEVASELLIQGVKVDESFEQRVKEEGGKERVGNGEVEKMDGMKGPLLTRTWYVQLL